MPGLSGYGAGMGSSGASSAGGGLPLSDPLGGLMQMGFGTLTQGLGARADRRFTERQSALNQLNEYKKAMAMMMAQDPARFIEMALAGMKKKTTAKSQRIGGLKGSVYKRSSKEVKALLDILANPETYNLAAKAGGGYDLNLPGFNPAVSEKYKPDLGGFVSDGQTQQFGAPTAPISYGPAGAPPPMQLPPMQVPRPGFTSKWG